MCVDTIKRVKALHKEIRINQSLSSTRKQVQRSSSATKSRFMNSSVKLISKGKTLAEVQEDMKQDFQTQTFKEAKKYLEKKVRRSRQESEEALLRLTGDQSRLPYNRHKTELVAERLRSAERRDYEEARVRSSSASARQGSRYMFRSQTTKTAMDVTEANQINSRITPANMANTISEGQQIYGISAGRGFANHDLGVSNGNLNLDNSLADKTALIIIDMQNDFCEGGDPAGSLAVPGSLEILSLINHLRDTNLFDMIIRSRDWHPKDHVSFVESHPGKELFSKIVVEETGRD